MLALLGGSVVLLLVVVLVPVLRKDRGSSSRGEEHDSRTPRALETAATSLTEASNAPASKDTDSQPIREAPEGESGPRLRLRVLDAFDFRPLEGVRAALLDHAEPTTRRTDAEGRCEFPVSDPPAENLLLLEKAGYLAFRGKGAWEGSESLTLERVATLRARIVAADTEESLAGAWVEFVPLDREDPSAVHLVADARGRVEVAPLAFGRSLTLTVGADGFATRELAFSLSPEDTEPIEHEIHLPRGVRVSGRVTDFTSGAPIAGARVGLHVGAFVTDAEGRFDVHVEPDAPGAELAFEVHAFDHVSLIVRGSIAELTSELELRLPGLAWIEGEVRDDAGQPVDGAQVIYQPGEPERDQQGNLLESTPLYELPAILVPWLEREWTRTTEDGRYRLGVLPWALGGDMIVSAGRHELQQTPWSRTGAPGSTQRATFRLTRSITAPTILGQLLLNGVPAPLAGELRWRGPTRAGRLAYDPEQGFEVVVEPGRIEIEAEFAAFPGLVSLPLSVQLGPHSTRAVYPDVRVEEHLISGFVRDTSGAAFSGAEIWATCPWPEPAGSAGSSYSRFTRSAADGSYELRVIDCGSPFRVACFDGGVEDAREGIAAGASGVDFVLPRGRSLFVRVRDERTGAVLDPERGFTLFLSASGDTYTEGSMLSGGADPSGFHEYALAEERVDLLVLPQERLRALAPGIRTGVTRVGEEPLRLELVLQPGVALELELAGEPLSDEHELYLVEEALHGALFPSHYEEPLELYQERRRVNFDAHGRARLEGLAPGPLRFRLFPDDRLVTPALFRLDPGQPRLEVKLEPR